MSDELHFTYRVAVKPDAPLVELSAIEAEKVLRKRLEAERDRPADALWNLAVFYNRSLQHDKAEESNQQIKDLSPGAAVDAQCLLAFGQMCEMMGDYPAAVRYYLQGIAAEPVDRGIWFFLHNNVGYSFNQVGRFDRGEEFCRRAISIDSTRSNGFKNLGLALKAKGVSRKRRSAL
jgi:tetratricopeptide (TPR) repeat protein